ncbi:MAG TPA: riboflavin synthase [Candidatus Acetothermia bacterium]|nr:riboflavin synthase [Candidatus Acetothermia bacterium]
MFTGIVQGLGTVRTARTDQIQIALSDELCQQLRLGASICVNGVCLTVREMGAMSFSADLSAETARRTTLGALHSGARVNLEPAIRPTDRLDGHWVLGHVDTVSRVRSLYREGSSWTLEVDLAPSDERWLVEKGSIAVDGISLTPFHVRAGAFRCAVIPETFEQTTLRDRRPGDRVNLEFDILAKYVERMMQRVHSD